MVPFWNSGHPYMPPNYMLTKVFSGREASRLLDAGDLGRYITHIPSHMFTHKTKRQQTSPGKMRPEQETRPLAVVLVLPLTCFSLFGHCCTMDNAKFEPLATLVPSLICKSRKVCGNTHFQQAWKPARFLQERKGGVLRSQLPIRE